MTWRLGLVLAIAAAAVVAYVFGPQISPALADERARLNAVWAVLLAAMVLGWASGVRGLRFGAAVRYAAIWAAIAAALALVYELRG